MMFLRSLLHQIIFTQQWMFLVLLRLMVTSGTNRIGTELLRNLPGRSFWGWMNLCYSCSMSSSGLCLLNTLHPHLLLLSLLHWSLHLSGLLITMTGFCVIGLLIVMLHTSSSSFLRFRKAARAVGLQYVVDNVALLLVLRNHHSEV